MFNRFKELGIPVKMTRDSDITLTPKERTNKAINSFGNYKDVLLISNHINAGGGDGAEVIYALRNKDTLSNNILNNIAKTGQNIRSAYQRRSLVNNNKDYYFMQRDTGNLESVTVEYGFLDSKKDDVSQLKNNWRNLAEATVQGVLDYIGYFPLDTGVYLVKKGDTLYSISNKYGINVEELKKYNNLNNNYLSIGQQLKIPNISREYYLVQNGDTLYSISKKFNTTVDNIKTINNLKNNDLYIGQKLYLGDNTYIVEKGDTLYSISKKTGIPIEILKEKNNINGNIVYVGQVINI